MWVITDLSVLPPTLAIPLPFLSTSDPNKCPCSPASIYVPLSASDNRLPEPLCLWAQRTRSPSPVIGWYGSPTRLLPAPDGVNSKGRCAQSPDLPRSTESYPSLARFSFFFPSLSQFFLRTFPEVTLIQILISGSAFREPNLRHMHISHGGVRYKMSSAILEVLRRYWAWSGMRKSVPVGGQ